MISNGFVTVFCVSEDKEEFKRKGPFPAWTYRNRRIKTEANGIRESDKFDIRISLEMLDDVCPGDLVFFGKTDTDADMARCRRVASVKRNSFGIRPHWHLETEYIYR